MTRPLFTSDLYRIADYLIGRKASLTIAVSELGYDPYEYPEMRDWLRCELGVYQDKHTHYWHRKDI